MSPTVWFLVRFINGRAEIISVMYDTKKEAMEAYHQTEERGIVVCETIYG